MSAVAVNGAHGQDAEFAEKVYREGCPHAKCRGDQCPLWPIVSFGEGSLVIKERFNCWEAAEIFNGGKV